MTGLAYIEVQLTLLAEAEGGRKQPLFLDNEKALYCPHIVIGSASQRKPILKNGQRIDEEYLGVQFRPCPLTLKPGDSASLILDLLYYPSIQYDKVVPGSEFTLRDGGKVIGFGKVLSVNFDG